jgi:hypothetical protein
MSFYLNSYAKAKQITLWCIYFTALIVILTIGYQTPEKCSQQLADQNDDYRIARGKHLVFILDGPVNKESVWAT